MKRSVEIPNERRFVVPWALFAGVLVSFVACCLAGRQTAKKHQLVHFTRFHQMLSPESLFYPTASQVQRLALARTRKDRINVIIGGSSVMQGTGQRANEVWTDKLAKLLGPDYRVLNLGARAANSGEFGAIAAEMILDRRKVIFLTDIVRGPGGNDPDGRRYRYFFWDAWYKGLIDRSISPRKDRVAELWKERSADSQFPELLRGAQLDSKFYFNDLWNTVVYTTGSAVWNRVCLEKSFQPRKQVRDNEPAPPPVAERPAAMERMMPFEKFKSLILVEGFKPGPDGRWVADADWLERSKTRLRNILSNQQLRQRTIMIISKPNPYIIDVMSADEQAYLSAMTEALRKVIEASGMRSTEFAPSIVAEDYADHGHLTASGGEKLALQMAPLIRELAESLGYVTKLSPHE